MGRLIHRSNSTSVSVTLLFALIVHGKAVFAAGFIDLNAYPYMSDVSNDSSVTLNLFANLPNRFSYFSLTNLCNEANEDELSQFDGYR